MSSEWSDEPVLAVESSCDESALALFDPRSGLIGSWIHSQIDQHMPYGGVVPDIASRSHLEQLPRLLRLLVQSELNPRPGRLAVTVGPGLAACLALGVAMAKSLALAWKIPLQAVNHLHGHAFSPFIPVHAESPADFARRWPQLLPHLGLIVSGGNTILFCIDSHSRLSVIAQTIDDAAGEALDKGARLLGMPYPGGPLIEKEALHGDSKAFAFPVAFPSSKDMKFSFSGLKTSLRYRIEAMTDDQLAAQRENLCASYQAAVIEALVRKTSQAIRNGHYRSLGLSGGVANNKALRQALATLAQRRRLPFFPAQPAHTGDNAAMIAFAAWIHPQGAPPIQLLQTAIQPALSLQTPV